MALPLICSDVNTLIYFFSIKVILDSIAPAVVSFAIGLGLGKMFGKTHGYEVEPGQELIAQGAANIFGSFFSCIPMAGSLSRSVVQEASGCR